MALPFFFVESLSEKSLVLDEDTSRHIIRVLRMKNQDPLLLTDGKGKKATAIIQDGNSKKCKVDLVSILEEVKKSSKTAIAISLIKNASRFEWFLEKATEIGVGEIIPMLCERTEKEKFRLDRMKGILVSAMLQSQQCWLPILHEPTSFGHALELSFDKKFIAHCMEGEQVTMANKEMMKSLSSLVLIGPEGDFTPGEIRDALQQQFAAISLGKNRLRTETAGIVAAILLGLES